MDKWDIYFHMGFRLVFCDNTRSYDYDRQYFLGGMTLGLDGVEE